MTDSMNFYMTSGMVFADTSVLLKQEFFNYVKNNSHNWGGDLCIYIPRCVINHLKYRNRNETLTAIQSLLESNCFRLIGENNHSNTTECFAEIISNSRLPLMFLTQDYMQAINIREMSKQRSLNGIPTSVRRINKFEELKCFDYSSTVKSPILRHKKSSAQPVLAAFGY